MSKKFLNSYKYPRPIPLNTLSWPLVHPREPLIPLFPKERPANKKLGRNQWVISAYIQNIKNWITQTLKKALQVIRSLLWIPEILLGHKVIQVTLDNTTFKVMDLDDMKYIWSNGFYGKGVLSRSEPTWLLREQKRVMGLLEQLNGDINANNLLSTVNYAADDNLKKTFSEEITKIRRMYREEWKSERDAFLKMENKLKQNSIDGQLSKENEDFLDKERNRLSLMKEELHKGPKGINRETWDSLNNNKRPPILTDDQLLEEDLADVLVDFKNIENIEYLQLTPSEAVFLLQMNIIKIANWDLKSIVAYLVDKLGHQFIVEYAVYYHYKSLGWCVKPGLKFSTDLVLYSRGMPFTHAEFAIKIVSDSDTGTFGTNGAENLVDYSAINRVVTGVKKFLVLCYVQSSGKEEVDFAWEKFQLDGDLISLINNFYIAEVGFRRWAPSRTRM